MPRRRSTAYRLTESTLSHSGKAITSAFRWAATDHYDISKSLSSMPNMGFLEEIKFILIQAVFSVIGAILSAIWITFLLFFVLPYLLFGTTLS